MRHSRTWIVIPSYNEGAVISQTLRDLAEWLPRIVVVDDGSTDRTSAAVLAEGARLVRHSVNLGQGAALMTGIRHALDHGADTIVTFDADGQHRPSDIHVLLQHARDMQADVVLGSRFLTQESAIPPARRLLLKVAAAYTNMTSGLALTDTHNGLRLFNRKAAEGLNIRQNRMAHASEMISWLGQSGLKIVEAPVKISYSEYSLAKGQNFFSSFNILWDLWSRKLHN